MWRLKPIMDEKRERICILMDKIRVAICDDAEYLCKSYKLKSESEPDILFVSEAHNSTDCLDMVRNNQLDVLLLDIQMEDEMSGVDIVPDIKEIAPNLKVIILTSYDDENFVFKAFLNGADDYIVKSLDNINIFQIIRNVFYNISMLRPEIAQKISKKLSEYKDEQKSVLYLINIMSKLSIGEFEVLKFICSGESYKQIAKRKYVEESTIRTLASRIIKKFEVARMDILVKRLRATNVLSLFDNKE